jgi:hypothetical protein
MTGLYGLHGYLRRLPDIPVIKAKAKPENFTHLQ